MLLKYVYPESKFPTRFMNEKMLKTIPLEIEKVVMEQ